jgi:outer membrane protein assembly factor BamB
MMMNELFMKTFLEKYKISYSVDNEKIERLDFLEKYDNCGFLYDFISKYGGYVFDNGLFKIHTFDYVDKWTASLAEYFREEINPFDMICFASNWQGCMYCVDKKNSTITYFDPATCEFFSADASLKLFFDDILVSGEYDIIFEDYFNEAFEYLKLKDLEYDNSLGHKIYLHLGGTDDVSNLEVVNTDVLWDLQIQITESVNEIDDD